MGFLDKLKLGHKDKKEDMPPPPEAPDAQGADEENAQSRGSELPPLPKSLSDDNEAPQQKTPSPQPAPTPDSQPQQTPKPATQQQGQKIPPPPKPASQPKQAPSPAPQQQAQKTPPPPKPAPSPQSQPSPAPSQPQQTSTPQKPQPRSQGSLSREDMRSAFSDIPPITVDDEDQGNLQDDQVEDLDVDKFVLPGEQEPEKPAQAPPQPQSRSAAASPTTEKSFEGPLYVGVDKYEEVQDTLEKLREDIQGITDDVEELDKLIDKEDEEFADVVKRVESVQDEILTIDEDLFEEQ